jgi:hypothetical protein
MRCPWGLNGGEGPFGMLSPAMNSCGVSILSVTGCPVCNTLARRAIEAADKEEKIIQRALDQARAEAAVATAEQQAALDATIEELNRKLAEAEAKNQRALSMAQQTRKGTVYVVSNVGSFGDPERAAIVRRIFKQCATGTCTKQEILQKATQWGLTNRRGQPLSAQAIGMLLRNRLYVGIIDVPEFGVRDQRGFAALGVATVRM